MKRSDLYKAIRDRAKDQLPDIAIVDLQKQQLRAKAKDEFPYPLPALLVEFKNARFTNQRGTKQQSTFTVSLQYALDLNTCSFDGAELEQETIELLDKSDEIYESFHLFRIDNIALMSRVSESPPEYGNRFIAFTTDFELTVFEDKVNNRQKHQVPPVKINTSFLPDA